MFEEAILEQTENILLVEIEKAAADAVKKSLVSLSPASNTTAPSNITDNPDKEEKTADKEEILLNINVDWQQVASLANDLIESIPKDQSGKSNNVLTVS